MAVERDTSYREHAPADTIELVDELRQKGIEVKDPVWTIGRLDERGPAPGPASPGHGKSNGNGHGNGESPPAPSGEEI